MGQMFRTLLMACLATSVAAAQDARPRVIVLAFDGAAGWSVEVVAPGDGLQVQVFDPLNVRVLGDRQVLHTRWLGLAGGGVELEVLGRTALTRGRPGHPLFAGVEQFRITGLPEPDLTESGDTLRVRQDGLTLTAIGATVERDGQEIRIVAPR